MSTPHAAAVKTEGLRRTFGDFTAVDGIDLDVRPGEIYGFLGPNGAGKSTVVRMLTTLLEPTGGSAWVGGLDVVTQADDVRFSIGVALQEAGLDENMTGREILATQGRLFGLNRSEIADRIEQLLRACAEQRELLPAERSLDVRFDEFMKDDVAMVERIYRLAGQPFDAGVRAAMDGFMEAHPRGRHGRVLYDLADFGMTQEERRGALAFYTERFGVASEGTR